MLRDKVYKEVDGVYIVYQGHVDILSQKDNRLLHQINIFENFGESTIVNTPSYEYFGDLYAGLNPRNPREMQSFSELMKENLNKIRVKLEQKRANAKGCGYKDHSAQTNTNDHKEKCRL